MNYSELDLAVLKHILTNKKHALDFVNEQDAKLFSMETWNFATLITNHIKTYKESPTLRVLTEKLAKGNKGKLIDTVKHIWEQLDKIQVDDKEYQHDLEKIKLRFAENQLLEAKASMSKLEAGSIDINRTLVELQKTIQNVKALDHSKSYEIKNIKDHLPIFVDKFNAKKNDPTVDRGLMTKYSFFDYATNGLKPADFVIIAGETGFGKSLFLNNIAIQVWMQDNKISFSNTKTDFTGGKNVIYFSLEMPYEDCFNRLLSRLSGVPSRKIENADLNKEEFNKIRACLDFIKEYPYTFKIVDIANACANDLETILVDTGEDFDAIFIDYLGIMKPNEKTEEQDWLKQGIIAYETRAIARKYGKPMFSAVQLNRKSLGKDSSENIGLSRLARSSTIATHVTHVIQIESRQGEEHHPDFIFHVIKNRKGPKGKGVLIKNLASATLLDKEMELPKTTEQGSDINYDDFFKDQDDISEEMEDLE